MREYLEQYPQNADTMRLKLAQILAVEHQSPDQAMREMMQIEVGSLDERQREFFEKLRAKIRPLVNGSE
jgi:hypothetical protein